MQSIFTILVRNLHTIIYFLVLWVKKSRTRKLIIIFNRKYLLARNLLRHTSHCIDIRSNCSESWAVFRPRASFSKISWFFSRARRSKWYWRSSPTEATSNFFNSRFTYKTRPQPIQQAQSNVPDLNLTELMKEKLFVSSGPPLFKLCKKWY